MRTTIDRTLVNLLALEAEEALQAVAANHGLTLTKAGGRFSDTTFTPKFTFTLTTESGEPADFASHAKLIGLPPDCWGQTFTGARGTQYTITGIKLSRPKYPVSGTGPKGGSYKFTTDNVLKGLDMSGGAK
ncbi:hypothetical protein CMI47_01095 [Candidatus Pacearchaeota archaeon]|nr:hypothetical protein [Candidatus Pacearchaeota archaeon]|tara:strand:+ start:2734 stop:3126 length:393 start_codon:yes stop_codon:yes gene_type:complete